MITIDGSLFSGSGTILRYGMSLATLIGEPLHISNIRTKRDKPGLRPQHLQVVRACCLLSKGQIEGDTINSTEIFYRPNAVAEGGTWEWDIGTAGSTTMLALSLIPIALFGNKRSAFSLQGGLFQDFAPSAFHIQKVLIPLLQKMRAAVTLEIRRPGYVPKGQGHLTMEVLPLQDPLQSVRMDNQGRAQEIRGISLSSHLEKQRVSERMAEHSVKLLKDRGYNARIDIIKDHTAFQRGAALLIWAKTDEGCLLGADRAGRLGRSSEEIAAFVVNGLMEDLSSGATVDRHLADQLILFAALGEGTTEYRIPMMTEHIETNLWLVERILGAKTALQGNRIEIAGVGFRRKTA